MNDPVLTTLERRVQRLEREGRRWRTAALALGLGLLGTLVSAAAAAPHRARAADEVHTRRLVLDGDDGAELAVLEANGKGDPQLTLRRENRVAVLTLTGPGLLVRDGKRGAFLGVDSRGTTALELTGEDLQRGIRATVSPDGSAGYYLLGDAGRRRAGLEALSTGQAQVVAYDAEENVRLQGGVDADGDASVLVLDPTGQGRVGMVQAREGQPVLALQDALGRLRAQLTEESDGTPRLELLREDGGAIWRKP